MAQLTVQLSDRADALIAQLQKELFNRRRKKVTPAGVVESLVESAARSPSDKRFATAWSNLLADIDKAARAAAAHGLKPANLSDEEWSLVLQHRSRRQARAEATSSTATAPTATATATAATRRAAPRKRSVVPASTRTDAARAGQPRAKRASRSKTRPVMEAAPSLSSSHGLALASPL